MPPAPEFTPTISFGNVIQILVFVVGISGSYFMMSAQAAENARAIDTIIAYNSALEARIRKVEQDQVRSEEKFANILVVLGRIEVQLDRMSTGGKP